MALTTHSPHGKVATLDDLPAMFKGLCARRVVVVHERLFGLAAPLVTTLKYPSTLQLFGPPSSLVPPTEPFSPLPPFPLEVH